MSWDKIENPKLPANKPGIMIGMSMNRSSIKMSINIKSALMNGKVWDGANSVNVFFGSDANEGKLLITPMEKDTGEFKIARMKGTGVIRIPDQPWFDEGTKKGTHPPEGCTYEKSAASEYIVNLPDWARRDAGDVRHVPSVDPVSVDEKDYGTIDLSSVHDAGDETPNMTGNVLFYGANSHRKKAKFTDAQAELGALLCERFEMTVTFGMIKDLGIVDYMPLVSKMRPKLLAIGLDIEKINNVGYKLKPAP